jgi:hypothetical protein
MSRLIEIKGFDGSDRISDVIRRRYNSLDNVIVMRMTYNIATPISAVSDARR